ncbi:hypothetical protein M406DRAFT_334307 [Cryphonectria parasitica EP155]|uniref:Uncharacterized protein n=1 Tax=Cryphonectria parasitica (strain ATCC 38755 / EP155) TaxID=660469 RepID=A0A9P4XU23_CRYP1|nr:uncharacterized protein M406DRAFT_334307 [Cryphonectria parasitica EP155]KAF3760680.1 hypothetical protein M406DRAFT_334307 [Cryphonectria parasitica EP155]
MSDQDDKADSQMASKRSEDLKENQVDPNKKEVAGHAVKEMEPEAANQSEAKHVAIKKDDEDQPGAIKKDGKPQPYASQGDDETLSIISQGELQSAADNKLLDDVQESLMSAINKKKSSFGPRGFEKPTTRMKRDYVHIGEKYRIYAVGHRKDERPEPEVVKRTGNYEDDYIRACYEADYPIVNHDAETDWDRRAWPNNKVPEGINMEMMRQDLLFNFQSPTTGWQAAGDTCAAKRAMTSAPSDKIPGYRDRSYAVPNYSCHKTSFSKPSSNDWHHAGDTCAGKRAMGGGAAPDTSYQNEAHASNDHALGYGFTRRERGVATQNSPSDFGGDACAWARSHIS